MNCDPELLFQIFKELYLKIMYWNSYEFLSVSFPWKKLIRKYLQKKGGFCGNYPLIFTLSGQSYAFKNYFSNLDYICHKSEELQRNLKHFKF